MTFSSKQLFQLSIFLISQFFLTRADPDKNPCIARPKECYPISLPVCAYPAGCNDFSCTRTAGNACFACKDLSINSYILGECPVYIPPTKPVEPEQPTETPEQEAEAEIDIDEPLSNCPNMGVAIQVNGEFIEGSFCCAELPVVCPHVDQPVCAILYECIGNSCQTTKANACEACHDPNVQLHVPGKCSDSFGQDWLVPAETSWEDITIWKDWEEVKLIGEEEYPLFEGEGQFENSEDFKIWVWWHSSNQK